MQWRFELTANGSYKILPKSGESSGCVLSTGSSQTDLKQGAYVDNASYLDEWYLYNITDSSVTGKPCDVYYLSIVHSAPNVFDTHTAMEKSFGALNNVGKKKYRFRKTSFIHENDVLEDLQNAQIVVIGSHGGNGYLSGTPETKMMLSDKTNVTTESPYLHSYNITH